MRERHLILIETCLFVLVIAVLCLLFFLVPGFSMNTANDLESVAAKPDPIPEFVGSYLLSQVSGKNGTVFIEELASARSLGIPLTLEIRESGVAEMQIFDLHVDMTWTEEDTRFDTGTESVPFSFSDGLLTFTADDLSLVFQKQ